MLLKRLGTRAVLCSIGGAIAVAALILSDRAYLLSKDHWHCLSNYIFSAVQVAKTCDSSEVFWRTALFLLAASIVVLVYFVKVISFFKMKPTLPGELTFSNKLYATELRVFVANLGLTADDRITLYLHVPKTDTFINIGRNSPNYTLRKAGRKSYKDGFIREVFNGVAKLQQIDADPLREKEKYVLEVSKKSNMKKGDVRSLTMYSRCLYGNVIKTLNGEPVGVLLIESKKKDFTHIEYDAYLDENATTPGQPVKRSLCTARLENIFAREVKRLSHFMDAFKVQEQVFNFEEGQI